MQEINPTAKQRRKAKDMKKMILMVVTVVFAINAYTVEVSEKFLNAIAIVESNGNPKAKGDYSKKLREYRAIGKYQLWKVYVKDVNRMSKKKFTYEDRWNPEKSKEMVKIYLTFYGKLYERNTGMKATNEILAKIHNGGPKGYAKKDKEARKNVEKYWQKVKKYM